MAAKKKKTNRSVAKQAAYERKIAALRANYVKRKISSGTDKKVATAKQNWKRIRASIPKLISTIPTRSHAELLGMFQNCVKKMAGRNPAEISDAVLNLRSAILREWQKRTESLVLGDEYFEWPTTDAPEGDGHLPKKSWRAIGMLSVLGYHVGVTHSLTETERRYLLDQIFIIPLPPLNDALYMREWASPKSANRLKKLAETIAALTRNAKRRNSEWLQTACDEWEADLAYLRKRYYIGHFHFGWPMT